MSTLKRFWPTPFKIEKGNIGSFLVQLIVFVVVCAVVGWVIGLLAKIWIIGIIFGLIGGLLELYSLVGIVLCILVFVGVIS